MDTSLPLHLVYDRHGHGKYQHIWKNILRVFFIKFEDADNERASLVKCELQGDLYERIWTHLLFFDELFPINFKVENFHVKIIHQPAAESTEDVRPDVHRKTLQIWLKYLFVLRLFVLPLQSVSRRCQESVDVWVTFPEQPSRRGKLSDAGRLFHLGRTPCSV